MVKWPFGRNKTEDNDNVPQEVQEYYQSEKRERVGVAWMLALATLVVTVLLALGIFYGGRWAYRALFDDNAENTPAEQQEQREQSENGDNTTEQNDDSEPAPATLPGDESDDSDAESQQNGSDSPSTTPRTGPSLPETGPSSNL